MKSLPMSIGSGKRAKAHSGSSMDQSEPEAAAGWDIPDQEGDPVPDLETLAQVLPTSGAVQPSEERANRHTWKRPLDFLFSCISVSVGLGNVWRFPYLCYKNGGGAFLIIYLLSMLFCGVPVFLQEVALGQFLGTGGMTIVAKVCPILKGVGIASMVMVAYYCTYYCIIVCWSLYYFLSSFVAIPDLPWNTCDAWWNTENCWAFPEEGNSQPPHNHTTTPVEEFWNRRVLQINQGLEFGLGNVQYELALVLLGSWTLVYLIVWRGLHQSGYVVWFTALFPYFVMITLLIRALTLDGAMEGLLAYVHQIVVMAQIIRQVDWTYMAQGSTWLDAATQIFFAYSVGIGALPALASYNSFNHNFFRDAMITCWINTLTCLTAGVLVFAILGHMAFLQDKAVNEVVESGPGLVFLTYPELVLSLPASFIWSVLFFSMLLVLGLDTQFCSVESLITGVVDNWPEYLLPHRKKFAFSVCLLLFLAGIPMVTNGGMYLFQLMDFYAASGMSLLWICFFQTIAISWVYGNSKFEKNIQQMLGHRPHWFWSWCWKAFSPVMMAGIFIYFVASFSSVKYGKYQYPEWAEVLGLLISFSSMMWVPLYAVYYLIKGVWMKADYGSLGQRLVDTLKEGTTPDFACPAAEVSNHDQDSAGAPRGGIVEEGPHMSTSRPAHDLHNHKAGSAAKNVQAIPHIDSKTPFLQSTDND